MTDRQLHAALDTIPGLVWLAGVDGAAEYLNRRWLEYSGLSQTQAIGWGWTAAVHPDDVDQLRFLVPGVVNDLAQLRHLYDLFTETLEELFRMGSAYKADPGV